MSIALSIKDLKKTYDNKQYALQGVSLEIPTGDFYALLGPNGAGKSTLINIVCGLVNKTSGEVRIEGMSIDDDYQKAKMHVGVVPQEFNFNMWEKVIDVVLDQAGYYGISRKQAMPRAQELLKQLGIFDKRDTQSRKLSGGMKRRLMIARGLIHQPRLLILDEPTAGVDIELRRGMWDFLRELNESGTTIILTTHYLEEAEQLCRNLSIINKGEIVLQGEMKKLLGSMHMETFIFDLEGALSPETEKLIEQFGVKKIDAHTIEMSLAQGETLSDAILALSRLDIRVRSMHNKANRLEELFIHLTKK